MGPTRLINTRTLELEELWDTRVRYAILSHRWVDEVTLQQWQRRKYDEEICRTSGYVKIKTFCRLAYDDGYDYVWVDTNCIDKTNSSELSEAINSMFAWYRDAARCYVYLHDLKIDTSTGRPQKLETAGCEWFTRGWTLQELLAPQNLWFYSKNWTCIGSKSDLSYDISRLTRIDHECLHDTSAIYKASIAKRMSWASDRITGKSEDMAYSLLGIFDINMPLLYGEGGLKAFRRLQEEIIKVSTDQTIFAWEWPQNWKPTALDWVTFFAPSPMAFKNSYHFIPTTGESYRHQRDDLSDIYSMDNLGLSIKLPILDSFSRTRYSFAGLKCVSTHDGEELDGPTPARLLGIPLYRDDTICARRSFPPAPIPVSAFRARDMIPIHACRGGNEYMNAPETLLHTPTLYSGSGARYYFMCFSIDKRTPRFRLGRFDAPPGSGVYDDVGIFVLRMARDGDTITGMVTLDYQDSVAKLGGSSEIFSLYLGVRSIGRRRTYHCNVASIKDARELSLSNWTRQLSKEGERARSHGRHASDTPMQTFEIANRIIEDSSKCSGAAVHLGRAVNAGGPIFIPVYISISDDHRSGGKHHRPRSLVVERHINT